MTRIVQLAIRKKILCWNYETRRMKNSARETCNEMRLAGSVDLFRNVTEILNEKSHFQENRKRGKKESCN